MGVASLVLGIISILFAWIPVCGAIFALPALIGLFLGIAFIAESKKHNIPHGMGIAGVILNGVALFLIVSQLLFLYIGGKRGTRVISNTYDTYQDSVTHYTESLKSVKDSIAAEIERELEDE